MSDARGPAWETREAAEAYAKKMAETPKLGPVYCHHNDAPTFERADRLTPCAWCAMKADNARLRALLEKVRAGYSLREAERVEVTP